MPANIRGIQDGRGGGPCAFSERCVMDAMPVGSGVLQEGRWVLVNPAWARLLGEPSAEALLGRALSEWMPAAARPELQELLATAPLEAEGKSRTRELVFDRGGGERVTVEVTATRMVSREGDASILLAGRDVTERKMLQERLVVSDRMASIGVLAAGVAHEINNPLVAVISNLEFAAEDLSQFGGELPAEARQGIATELADAGRAAERVQKIVRDLREVSHAGTDEIAAVDPVAVMESALRIAEGDLQRRARLLCALDAVPPVAADATRLAQVFLNLVINALQAIPEGRPEENVVRVATHVAPSGEVVVTVEDSGCGMSEEVRGRLFTPFFTTKPPGQGTGLGLSLCQRYLEAFEGRISVDSEPGEGSTFRVHLRPFRARSVSP